MSNRAHFNANDLSIDHYVKYTVEGNKLCYVLSGIYNVNLVGSSTQNWITQKTYFEVPIRDLPAGQGLSLENWAPHFTLSSIYDQSQSINSGFAINYCGFYSQNVNPSLGYSTAWFYAELALRDSDAWIYKIGYSISLKGSLKPLKK